MHAELDTDSYPTGVKVSDAQMDAVAVTGHTWHGEWNYTLHPQPASTPGQAEPAPAPETWDRTTLTDPALTGISRTDLDALAAVLAAPQQARRDEASHQRLGANRRRAPGAGRRPKLTLTDQITAALLHRRLTLPITVLARLFAVSTETARDGISQAQQLLNQHRFPPTPAVAHLSTLAGLSRFAATCGIHPTPKIKPAC